MLRNGFNNKNEPFEIFKYENMLFLHKEHCLDLFSPFS